MTRQEFAQALKQYRKQQKLTQEAAAEALGVSLRTWQNWEIARNMPTGYGLNALLRIVNAAAPGGDSGGGFNLPDEEATAETGTLETHLL